jgi:hypothetical protein
LSPHAQLLAKDERGARDFAKEVSHLMRRRVGACGAVVIADTVRSEIAEELEIYEEDFAEEVSTS